MFLFQKKKKYKKIGTDIITEQKIEKNMTKNAEDM